MKSADFLNSLEKEKHSRVYKIYLETREIVLKMLDNEPENGVSKYWQEELAGFEYMLDASPLMIKNLRHHSYHLTGLYEYSYRNHHAHRAIQFQNKFNLLKSKDKNGILVAESPELGGFGFKIDGKLYNIDTLKFYECLIILDEANLLDQFRGGSGYGKTVFEIGSGWGGLAYQFKKLFPKLTYVIVDFPLCFIFSATYLKFLFPEAKILLIDGSSDSYSNLNLSDYDFVFIPHYLWDKIGPYKIDLLLNTVSFQEMTSGQVTSYIKKARDWGCPNIYSLNRDRSHYNTELTTISSILNQFYDTKELDVAGVPYHSLSIPKKSFLSSFKNMLFGRKTKSVYEYRHLIGRIK